MIFRKMEICLALYDEDDQWYRALFLAYLKNGTVLVHYFDYGNVSKNMSKELIFPLYAHQIYIDDCIKSDERAVTFAKNIQKCPTIYADVHINENEVADQN
ncbi:uncharacterized protein ACN2A1_011403 isoform 2-T2 [Glossina fuscipes fuscipes]